MIILAIYIAIFVAAFLLVGWPRPRSPRHAISHR